MYSLGDCFSGTGDLRHGEDHMLATVGVSPLAPSLMLGTKVVTWSRVRLATLVSTDKHNIDAGTDKLALGDLHFQPLVCVRRSRDRWP